MVWNVLCCWFVIVIIKNYLIYLKLNYFFYYIIFITQNILNNVRNKFKLLLLYSIIKSLGNTSYTNIFHSLISWKQLFLVAERNSITSILAFNLFVVAYNTFFYFLFMFSFIFFVIFYFSDFSLYFWNIFCWLSFIKF